MKQLNIGNEGFGNGRQRSIDGLALTVTAASRMMNCECGFPAAIAGMNSFL